MPRWLLFLALTACTAEEGSPPPTLEPALPGTEPDAVGPYGVGVTTFEITYDARTLPVEVWYPAAPGGDATTYQVIAGGFVLFEVPSPRGAARDAPLDYRGAPHPVVMFSHGFGGMRIQSVYLAEYLASHGFVVAAPDHVGNTFSDMSVVAIEAARFRPIDISRALDGLLARSDGWPEERLAFAADPDRIGMAGHSFGGYTTFRIAGATIDPSYATCETDPDQLLCDGYPPETPFPESGHDPRFVAAMPQAPGGASIIESGFGDVAIPVMIQAGTTDETTPFAEEAEAPFAALERDAWLVSIENAGHFTFSDLCRLDIPIEQFDDGCGEANIPYDEAHDIITRYAVAFFKLHVAGDDQEIYRALLDSDAALPVTLSRK